MSQAPGDHTSPNSLSCLKDEADARALDERVDETLGRELWTIHAVKKANKQSGNGARLVRTQRAVA